MTTEPTLTTIQLVIEPGTHDPFNLVGMLRQAYEDWAIMRGVEFSFRDGPHPGDVAITATGAPDQIGVLNREIGVHRMIKTLEEGRYAGQRGTMFASVRPAEHAGSRGYVPVRSYVFDPYIKAIDHRYDTEIDDPGVFFSGELEVMGP